MMRSFNESDSTLVSDDDDGNSPAVDGDRADDECQVSVVYSRRILEVLGCMMDCRGGVTKVLAYPTRLGVEDAP